MGIVLGSVAAALVLGALLGLCLVLYLRYKDPHGLGALPWRGKRKQLGDEIRLKGARHFSLDELRTATNNFAEESVIGVGGYGKVYKGVLRDGELVAVKCVATESKQGLGEFRTEIELLSRVHHKNLVALLGFCNDNMEQMLVYPFMAGGNVREHLMGTFVEPLSWGARLEIAVGAARGLSYLHSFAHPPIIHRDVKSTNILLDAHMVPKVADFGLGKPGPSSSSSPPPVQSTKLKGTAGYMDPEYYRTNQVTEKSDVYGFGVVLLELISGLPPIVEGCHIIGQVKELLSGGGIRAVADPQMGPFFGEGLQAMLALAFRCTDPAARSRPSMSTVEKELERVLAAERVVLDVSCSGSWRHERGASGGSSGDELAGVGGGRCGAAGALGGRGDGGGGDGGRAMERSETGGSSDVGHRHVRVPARAGAWAQGNLSFSAEQSYTDVEPL